MCAGAGDYFSPSKPHSGTLWRVKVEIFPAAEAADEDNNEENYEEDEEYYIYYILTNNELVLTIFYLSTVGVIRICSLVFRELLSLGCINLQNLCVHH